MDRLLIPGNPPAEATRHLDGPSSDRLPTGERIHVAPDAFAFDAVLADIARHDSRASARLVATGIEYLGDLDSHTGPPWPTELLLRPLTLSLLGLLAAVAIRRSHREKEMVA